MVNTQNMEQLLKRDIRYLEELKTESQFVLEHGVHVVINRFRSNLQPNCIIPSEQLVKNINFLNEEITVSQLSMDGKLFKANKVLMHIVPLKMDIELKQDIYFNNHVYKILRKITNKYNIKSWALTVCDHTASFHAIGKQIEIFFLIHPNSGNKYPNMAIVDQIARGYTNTRLSYFSYDQKWKDLLAYNKKKKTNNLIKFYEHGIRLVSKKDFYFYDYDFWALKGKMFNIELLDMVLKNEPSYISMDLDDKTKGIAFYKGYPVASAEYFFLMPVIDFN